MVVLACGISLSKHKGHLPTYLAPGEPIKCEGHLQKAITGCAYQNNATHLHISDRMCLSKYEGHLKQESMAGCAYQDRKAADKTLWQDVPFKIWRLPASACGMLCLSKYEGTYKIPGLILGLHPANERRRYNVTLSLIAWAQT